MIESNINNLEKILWTVSNILRGQALSATDEITITLGLFYLLNRSYREERQLFVKLFHEEDIKNNVWKIEQGLFELAKNDSDFDDIKFKLMVSLKKIESDRIEEIVYLFSRIDFFEYDNNDLLKVFRNYLFRISEKNSRRYGDILFTNNQLGQLLNEIIDIKKDQSVYDPAAGVGMMLSYLNTHQTSKIVLQERISDITVISKLFWKLVAPHQKINFHQGDSLYNPAMKLGGADLIITEPPFSARNETNIVIGDSEFFDMPTRDTTESFIQLIVSRLSPNGKAFILITDGFLFKNPRRRNIKQFIVDEDLVESIISLPSGFLMPISGIKTSILVLNKNKPIHRKGEVLFINGDSTSEKRSIRKTIIDVSKIGKIYNGENSKVGDDYIKISTQEIRENDYVLQSKKYLDKRKVNDLSQVENNESLVPLKELLKPKALKKNTQENIPFLKVGNLANDLFETVISMDKLEVLDEKMKGRLLDESALITARVGEKLKPSYFEFDGKPISINSNTFIFSIDESIVDREYLIFELETEYFKTQLASVGTGSVIPSWSKKDFLNLKIKIPKYKMPESILLQKEITNEKKQNLIAEKQKEFDALKERLKVDDKGLEIISNFKHDFMGNLERISSGAKLISQYIEDKHKSKKPVDYSDFVFEPIDGVELSIPTIKDSFLQLEENILKAINILEYEIDQIKEDRVDFKFEVKNVFALLSKIKKEYPVSPNFVINVNKDLGIENVKMLTAKVDLQKINKAISNLIDNARKHGFNDQTDKMYEILFEVNIHNEDDKTYIQINYRNNGAPFPDGFTFNDFIQRGKRAGETSNTGIGGDRINRIIKRHDGVFREIPNDDDEVNSYNINFEILIPQFIE